MDLTELLTLSSTQYLIEAGLKEDIGTGDVTTDTLISPDLQGRGSFIAKENIVICGLPIVTAVFQAVDPAIVCTGESAEGAFVNKGTCFATVRGPFASILKGERVALNFLCHLTGIATLTNAFVRAVEGTVASILDTRKTTPGYRLLEKYAVSCGGGKNHRVGLYDAVLIKDNHISSAPHSIAELIQKAREKVSQAAFILIEIDSMEQLEHAISARPDIIMLDNMGLQDIHKAREMIPPSIAVEISGNVTLKNVRDYALCGVERISVGALTHSAPAADISLKISSEF